MLINHRHSAYVDAEELERAAGLLSIEAEKYGYDEPHYHQLQGASAAIRALCEQKTITAAEDSWSSSSSRRRACTRPGRTTE